MKNLSIFKTFCLTIFMVVGFSVPLRGMELVRQGNEAVADAWLEAEPERLAILMEAFNSLPGDEPLTRERMRWMPKGCQQLIATYFLMQCEEAEEAARREQEEWVRMERARYQAWQRPRDFWPMIDENEDIVLE